jgi:hypothetical protein
MKIYTVWNASRSCMAGFINYDDAYYCVRHELPDNSTAISVSPLADEWVELFGDEDCDFGEVLEE